MGLHFYITEIEMAKKLHMTIQNLRSLRLRYRGEAKVLDYIIDENGNRLYHKNRCVYLYSWYQRWQREKDRWDGVRSWTDYKKLMALNYT